MRIITRQRLKEFWQSHRNAKNWLSNWHDVVRAAEWRKLSEVRKTFPHADAVKVASGKTVTVFNVCGNKFRLVTAIHYDHRRVFVLWIGTHAEYDEGAWKDKL